MINQYQSGIYNALEKAPKNTSGSSEKKPKELKEEEEEEKEDFSINRNCARLNLWPLVQEGKQAHPHLYELFAKLIRTFYGSLCQDARFEYLFLEAWLQAAQTLELPLQGLENARFTSPNFQKIYYKMLKGNNEIPSLLEYVKMEPSSDKICIFHANRKFLGLLFNPPMAEKLHLTIHAQNAPRLTIELIERIAVESHTSQIDPQLISLLELSNYFKHREHKKFFLSNDKGIHLRKQFIMEAPK